MALIPLSGVRMLWCCAGVAAACLLPPPMTAAQGLTGALIGTVKDAQGRVIPEAVVRISSPALIGGPSTQRTDEKGELRFPALPPGSYELDVEVPGFATYREPRIQIRAGATMERPVVLTVASLAESIVVEGTGSLLEARDPGFGTRFGPADLSAIPTRRASMFDPIRAAPGISPTSPSSGTITTVSAFGSGTNENQFLIDGTNFTCPCNGVARSEPGVDFIQEIHVHSTGASAEFGNMQGAVVNVITRQGGERLLSETSYYHQAAGLTSQPVRLALSAPATGQSGYERTKYQDFTANVGGPVVGDRLWFFAGYQHLRDSDSQPGTDPAFPRTYEQDKFFVKLTWQLAPGWRLVQSMHNELWVNPAPPTRVTPFEATTRTHASVPAITFGQLTHVMSANTLWDLRVGRFVYAQDGPPSTGDPSRASHRDRLTGVTSGAPAQFGSLTIQRTTAKATITHYREGLLATSHDWKTGGQFESGGHRAAIVIPTGVRYVDDRGEPFQAISREPSHEGGALVTAAVFASDAIRMGDRLTINAGVRFDHSRAISQDLHGLDLQGRETDRIVPGLGTLYRWNIVSPRLGVVTKLTADGRTILRSSYGRFSQGVLTGEFAPLHPAVTVLTTSAFEPSSGDYTRLVSVVDPRTNLQLDPGTRAPRTDEYSVGVDRQVGRDLTLAVAYIRKRGDRFIGWKDVGGQYEAGTHTLDDGRTVTVFRLVNATGDRRFLLTNPEEYSLTYNGFVAAIEKRRSRGWQAAGSYTLSRAHGMLPSSGTSADGAQASTVSPPNPITFGRDPNDLTNASGRLPNDRPHMFRVTTSLDLPRTGLVLAASLQHFSGKPWAATAQVNLPQGDQRILLERRGTRRLESQSLLDLRLSRTFPLRGVGRIEVLVDVLNLLDEEAGEALATDNLFSPNFGRPTTFVDPRRVMIGARLNLGR